METNSADNVLTAKLLDLVRTETGNPEASLESSFAELELESLEFLELIHRVEQIFSIRIPDDKFTALDKVSDFLAFLPS
jgi:acyl carrier protein